MMIIMMMSRVVMMMVVIMMIKSRKVTKYINNIAFSTVQMKWKK